MSPAFAFALGVAAGLVIGGLLIAPGNGGARGSGGGRKEIVEAAGPWAGTAYDLLGVGKYAPGLLNFFGVK